MECVAKKKPIKSKKIRNKQQQKLVYGCEVSLYVLKFTVNSQFTIDPSE